MRTNTRLFCLKFNSGLSASDKFNQIRFKLKLIVPILIFIVIAPTVWSSTFSRLLYAISYSYEYGISRTVDLYNEDNINDYDAIESRFRWPPDNPRYLQVHQTGFYNVTLPIRVDPYKPIEKDKIEAYVDYLYGLDNNEFQISNQSPNKLPLKRLVQLDEQVRIGSIHPNYMLYPQAVDLYPIIDAVRRGDTVKHAPINNPELLIKKLPQHVCNPDHITAKHYDIIVIIKSCVFCFEERNHARQTFMKPNLWPHFSIGFIFVMGQPVFEKHNRHTFYGYNVTSENRLPKMNPNDALRTLKHESEKHGDLLIGSFQDTYYNLTLKQITAYRWASVFCRNRTKLFLFMDGDQSLIPGNLIQFVKPLSAEIRKVLVAGVMNDQGDFIHRQSEHNETNRIVSETELPWNRFPPHIIGLCYLIGSDIVHDVSIAHAFTRQFRFEDVYLGIILHKLNRISVINHGFVQHQKSVAKLVNVISLPKTEADRLYDWHRGKPKLQT